MSNSLSNSQSPTLSIVPIEGVAFNDSNLGADINDRFESIHNNFQNIVSRGYLKGPKGDGLVLEKITHPDTATEYSYITNLIADSTDSTQDAVQTILGNNITITYISLKGEGTTKISSLPYVFRDPRFNKKSELNDPGNVEDLSCIIYYDADRIENGFGGFHKIHSFPTIYYNDQEKEFCWKINGVETCLYASGIKGDQGKNGKDGVGVNGSGLLLAKVNYNNTEKSYDITDIYLTLNEDAGWKTGDQIISTAELGGLISQDQSVLWIESGTVLKIGLGVLDLTTISTSNKITVKGVVDISNIFSAQSLQMLMDNNITQELFIPTVVDGSVTTNKHKIKVNGIDVKMGYFKDDTATPGGTLTMNYNLNLGTRQVTANKVIVNEQLTANGTNQVKNQYEVEYADLVELRRKKELIPGVKYRITNYETTVKSGLVLDYYGTKVTAANHPFDIIVEAVENNKLSEIARVAVSKNETEHFKNCKLEAWEIKYCLDNTEGRFAWANANGKGVIYYMKDEYGNEAPYDFKNILYEPTSINYDGGEPTIWPDGVWKSGRTYYTFGRDSDDSITGNSRGNVIKESYDNAGKLILPDIYLGKHCSYNIFENNCQCIRFHHYCISCTLEGNNVGCRLPVYSCYINFTKNSTTWVNDTGEPAKDGDVVHWFMNFTLTGVIAPTGTSHKMTIPKSYYSLYYRLTGDNDAALPISAPNVRGRTFRTLYHDGVYGLRMDGFVEQGQ